MGHFDSILNKANSIKDQFSKGLTVAPQTSASLGVDIGTHSVKVLRLDRAGMDLRVLGFGVEKVVEKNFRDALSKALVKARAVSQEGAVVSVAGQGVVSRYIEIPQMNKTELASSMKFEIEKYVPFAMAEVASDYAVVHELKDKAKISVLIAAAKNDLIQKKRALAQDVNVRLRAVDLDCLALCNFYTEIFKAEQKGVCSCIINMGKTVSNIDILVDGVPFLSRDIFTGGDDVTKKIAEVLEVEYAEAEKMKMEPPKTKKNDLAAAWDAVLNNLAGEIRVSLDYFEARNNRIVEKIYLVGGGSRLSGIEQYLEHLLAVRTQRLDYADRLIFDEGLDREDFVKNSDLLAIALGLALR